MKGKEIIVNAMKEHEKGNIEEAEKLYRKAIEEEIHDKRVYVNLAAILRSHGNAQEAAVIANEGLKRSDPNSPILFNTLANSLRDIGRYEEAINMYRRAIKESPDYYDPKISLMACLNEAGYKQVSDLCLKAMIKHYGCNDKGLVNQLIVREVEKASKNKRDINTNLKLVLQEIDKDPERGAKMPHHWFSLAQMCLTNKQVEAGIEYYNSGVLQIKNEHRTAKGKELKEKLELLYTCSSWNFGCALIRQGNFELGWKLYDHGLKTPCEGKQRWQRSLYKPFSYNKIPIWKGEHLKGKRLLLLGEQGIGDSMMFLSAIPILRKEGAMITIVIPDRLKEIYKRSLPEERIISDKECRENTPDHGEFDFQCPLGSIIQHRFKHISDFRNRGYKLKANKEHVLSLRKKYLGDDEGKKKLVGISWQGGGTKDRINDKSVKLKDLLTALKDMRIKLISLQYGDDAEIVKEHAKSHNMDFIDDNEIQATKDMNTWLDQVDACDAVISIANTTIHGAGGLNKPTICLLGNKADWRWLVDREEERSYWYPSVEIAWQNKDDSSWDEAFEKTRSWLKKQELV